VLFIEGITLDLCERSASHLRRQGIYVAIKRHHTFKMMDGIYRDAVSSRLSLDRKLLCFLIAKK
jgi:hypothetical protein